MLSLEEVLLVSIGAMGCMILIGLLDLLVHETVDWWKSRRK